MFNEDVITNALFEMQYQRVRKYTYKATWSTDYVEHYIYLTLTGKYIKDTINPEFGFRNPLAEFFADRCLVKYGGDSYRLRSRVGKHHCFLHYPFGELFVDTYRFGFNISDNSEASLVDGFMKCVQENLFPVIKPLTQLEPFLKRLLMHEKPCMWYNNNPALRAAHIVSISRQIGLNEQEILNSLRPHFHFFTMVEDVGDPEKYIENTILDWDQEYKNSQNP